MLPTSLVAAGPTRAPGAWQHGGRVHYYDTKPKFDVWLPEKDMRWELQTHKERHLAHFDSRGLEAVAAEEVEVEAEAEAEAEVEVAEAEAEAEAEAKAEAKGGKSED